MQSGSTLLQPLGCPSPTVKCLAVMCEPRIVRARDVRLARREEEKSDGGVPLEIPRVAAKDRSYSLELM